MKYNVKSFVTGLLVGTIGITTVFATSSILSAEFNNTNVIFNGTELDLNGNQMISVTTSGNSDVASNYMPVRTVLEQMGYAVDFDGGRNAVIINSKEITNETNGNNHAEAENTISNIVENKYMTHGEFSSNISTMTYGRLALGLNLERGVFRIGENSTGNILLEIPENAIKEDDDGELFFSIDYFNEFVVPLIEQHS